MSDQNKDHIGASHWLTTSSGSRTYRVDRPRVGLIAGWGRYPVIVAEALRRNGCEVYCLAMKDHADPALADMCDGFLWNGLGQLGRARRFFLKHGVREITMAGKIHKVRLFEPRAWLKHLPDWRGFRRLYPHFISGRKDRRDDTLLNAVVDEFASGGIRVAPATDFVPELLIKPGLLTRRTPTASERRDIDFGWRVAKDIGRLDIGQCVVVKGGAVIAVEAIEGTDGCIQRTSKLCPAGGMTAVKVAKPQQDMRFDVPTIGIGTLQSMVENGVRVLAVEAQKTIILDELEVVRFADRQQLSIVALDEQGRHGHLTPSIQKDGRSVHAPGPAA